MEVTGKASVIFSGTMLCPNFTWLHDITGEIYLSDNLLLKMVILLKGKMFFLGQVLLPLHMLISILTLVKSHKLVLLLSSFVLELMLKKIRQEILLYAK